jgi:hypothetical protein
MPSRLAAFAFYFLLTFALWAAFTAGAVKYGYNPSLSGSLGGAIGMLISYMLFQKYKSQLT